MQKSDITVIGAGPGGYVASIWGAKLGAKVILVEREKVGGTCLNWGCIPTKALVRSAEVYQTLLNAETFGCAAENVRVDMAKVKERKDQIVAQLVRGIEYLLKKNRVTVLQGQAKFLDDHTIAVDNGSERQIVTAKHIIVATGASPAKLSIPGEDLPQVMDSKQALQLDKLPRSLAIVGGGIIGMEFAFIYAHLGVKVMVIEYLDEILSTLDSDIRRQIRVSAKRAGINIQTGARVEAIIENAAGECSVVFTQKGTKHELTADKVLVAVGRKPEFSSLDLEKLGIRLNPSGRGILVNDHMQTTIPHIYAIGDVTDQIQLAHVASHQGIVAVNNIMGRSDKMDYSAIPNAIFTSPEIATVGISESQAKEQGLTVKVSTFPFTANGKALTYGSTRGFVKIIADKVNDKILGAGIIGPHATDLISELTLAVKNELTARQVMETIHAHPTTAEAIHEAALGIADMTVHI